MSLSSYFSNIKKIAFQIFVLVRARGGGGGPSAVAVRLKFQRKRGGWKMEIFEFHNRQKKLSNRSANEMQLKFDAHYGFVYENWRMVNDYCLLWSESNGNFLVDWICALVHNEDMGSGALAIGTNESWCQFRPFCSCFCTSKSFVQTSHSLALPLYIPFLLFLDRVIDVTGLGFQKLTSCCRYVCFQSFQILAVRAQREENIRNT